MIRIRSVFMVTGRLLLGVVLLFPSAAQADCLQWDISGYWVIDQSNGFWVHMDLQQTGTTISGNGSYGSKTFPHWIDFGGAPPEGSGTISGTIDNNNNIQLSTSWGGEYKGGVGSDGFIGGVTSPKGDSGSAAAWRSLGPVTTCLTATTPPSSAEPSAPPASPLDKAGVLKNPERTGVGEILKQTTPAPPPANAGGGGAEYATAIAAATIYEEPGGAAPKDANGDDVGIPAGSKWLVLAKKTDPVWYKLQTNPVGWVWGEDVTIGP